MNESLIVYLNPHNGSFKQLHWIELEIPSMCSEFDPSDGDTWTKVTYTDTSAGTAKEVDYKELRAIYKALVKLLVSKEIRKQVWELLGEITPYQFLGAKSQLEQDRQYGVFPDLRSKYIKDIPLTQLQEYVNDMKDELAGNLNDWRAYNEAYRCDSPSVDRERQRILDLDRYIENRH